MNVKPTPGPVKMLPLLLVMLTAGACVAHRDISLTIPEKIPDATANGEKPYVDLEPGRTLRIIVPLLASGGFLPKLVAQPTEGGAITLSAADVIGYTTSSYAIKGKKDGPVKLELVSTEESREGKTVPRASARPLPFALPRQTAHIRLLYLIRFSEADHGMAILASKKLDALNAFTRRLIEKPDICNQASEVSCSWVPAGIGVRTESP